MRAKRSPGAWSAERFSVLQETMFSHTGVQLEYCRFQIPSLGRLGQATVSRLVFRRVSNGFTLNMRSCEVPQEAGTNLLWFAKLCIR